jgi:hypothetical protein
MKNIFLLLVFATSLAFAQDNNEEKCERLNKHFNELYDANNYIDPYFDWLSIKKDCKTFNPVTIEKVEKLLRFYVDNKSGKVREESIEELADFYDFYNKNFPENTRGLLIKKAMLLDETKVGSSERIYNILNEALVKNRTQFTSVVPLDMVFRGDIDKYKAGKLTTEQFIARYQDIMAIIDLNKHQIPNSEVLQAASGFKNNFLGVISKTEFTDYLNKNFEAQKSNLPWLQNNLNALAAISPENELVEKIGKIVYENQASAKTAKVLGDYYFKNFKGTEGINYYLQILDLPATNFEKESAAATLANVYLSSDLEKSAQMLQKAIEINPADGQHYLLLAHIYEKAVKTCATNENTKFALYKLASETALTAGKKQAYLKETAQKVSDKYLEEITNKNLKGKTIKIDCWIQKQVTL